MSQTSLNLFQPSECSVRELSDLEQVEDNVHSQQEQGEMIFTLQANQFLLIFFYLLAGLLPNYRKIILMNFLWKINITFTDKIMFFIVCNITPGSIQKSVVRKYSEHKHVSSVGTEVFSITRPSWTEEWKIIRIL